MSYAPYGERRASVRSRLKTTIEYVSISAAADSAIRPPSGDHAGRYPRIEESRWGPFELTAQIPSPLL
jgi:hypothetical protein